MQIHVVNENDEIIGSKDKKDRNFVDITRVTVLWITDEEGNILITQRSFEKEHSPGLWGPAVAGTVEEGETYESNVIKEAQEEIGLENINPIIGPKLLRTTSHKYFAQWFTLVIPRSTKLKIKEDEVHAIKWVTKEELVSLIKNHPETFVPNFEQTCKTFLT